MKHASFRLILVPHLWNSPLKLAFDTNLTPIRHDLFQPEACPLLPLAQPDRICFHMEYLQGTRTGIPLYDRSPLWLSIIMRFIRRLTQNGSQGLREAVQEHGPPICFPYDFKQAGQGGLYRDSR